MEVYQKVIEKLGIADKNSCKNVNLQNFMFNINRAMKLSFSENGKNHELILIKTTHPLDCINYFNNSTNLVLPVFCICCDGAYYAVFKGDSITSYQLQGQLKLDHMVIILKLFVANHANFLLNKRNACNQNFLSFIGTFVQTMENNLNDGNDVIYNDLQLIRTQFSKILTKLETTLDKHHWVPSVVTFERIPIFFKYDSNGNPIDVKILVTNSCKFVPPLYDILVFIVAYTDKSAKEENLQKLLQLYYELLKTKLGNEICDLEQYDFQIRSFIPFIKLRNSITDINLRKEVIEFSHCPNLLREECNEILLNYLENKNFFLKTFSLTPLKRLGNLGEYFKLKIEISLEHQDQEINLFVKFLPSYNDSTNAIVESGPSKKETFFFNNFVKEFKNCGLKNFLNFAPKCFLSKTNHVLVLEDLNLQGYQLSTDQNNFTYEMLSLTVKKLAQLHACSLVFEETKSKEFGEEFRLDRHYYGDYLKEILFQTEEENELRHLANVGERTVTDYLIFLYPEIAKNITMQEFHNRSKLAYNSFYRKLLKSETYRNTLCHGDMWATNIMFKFNSDNVPIDCKLVDFQLTRYCPPTQDVLSFIYLTTNKITRTKYLNILLNEYYEELSKIVTNFGFDMENVFSATEFQNSCSYMTSQAVCQALLYAPINITQVEDRVAIFGDPENFEKIIRNDRRPFIEAMINKYPFYKGHIGELVQDLYDVCENGQY